ncbi:hypothetical protein GCM10011344_22770 [Dokdonia pacifica]|uniref:Uncharacterized protein n=1 Tax=Dokdonia pacifica TaxID=1627892 RepID=A0A238WKV0_9FLAO|nr:hypothetical protein [Dokdonia pacifica]GGG21423.1 hypothetical protein GCM10011344_22770 [Dokdonia pacifica]SNR46289.1 hypothetical protein SAMN06265376_1011107 [Dokdonia pacifica]
MKKSIKAELISLAHKILQLKDDTSYAQMTEQSRALYEKLMVLSYAEKLEQSGQPTIGLSKIEATINEIHEEEAIAPVIEKILEEVHEEEKIETPEPVKVKTPAEIVAENEARFAEARANDRHRPDGTVFNQDEPVHEPVIEKIKDIVAEMPPEASVIDELVDSIEPQDRYQKNDMLEIGREFAQTPVFEPVAVAEEDVIPKNLNDKLKSGLKIGLNDKLAFIKHLFQGSDADYNRVLSQLSTFRSLEEAKQFIYQMVKPDYDSWEGKEEYEERFIQIIESKFN